jgi:repressor LexA
MENRQAAMSDALTRRQREIFEYLREHASEFARPPTLDELCEALGLRSRGSLHKHVQALVDAGLVEPLAGRRRGLRLTEQALEDEDALPLLGYIAAGRPIEAVEVPEWVQVPSWLRSNGRCYVLQVRGDSMIDEGILDGDWVIIEQRDCARNGQIVVALIDDQEATLKRIEQHQDRIVLHPANARMEPMIYEPGRIRIQGILVGQMRRYG